jgi:DNA-binding IclR family transcriptional regulator
MNNTSKTVNKAIDILDTFLIDDKLHTLGDIARSTGLNTSTTYRLTSTLVKKGFLFHEKKGGTYSLGLKLMDYIYAIRRNIKYIDLSYLSLRKLCREQNESVYLAVRDGDESIVMEEVGVDEKLRINSPIGKRLKLHCTAGGKILMTALSQEERTEYYHRNPLRPFTKYTVTEVDLLEKELSSVKREGVAFDKEEYRMGIWAAAAPVYNPGGEIIAAVGILVLRSHVNKNNIDEFATAIKSCAGEISQVVSRIM